MCGVLARREGGAGVLPQKRCDWTGRRQNWLTVWQAPCLARGAALLERGGPLRSHFPLQVRPRAVQHRALAVRLLLAGG